MYHKWPWEWKLEPWKAGSSSQEIKVWLNMFGSQITRLKPSSNSDGKISSWIPKHELDSVQILPEYSQK